MLEEQEQQVALLASQLPVGAKPRIVEEKHARDLHVHYYRLEINDQGNGVVSPIQFEIAVDDEGKFIQPTEEEE